MKTLSLVTSPKHCEAARGSPDKMPPAAAQLEDYWAILGLEPGASKSEVQKAYRKKYPDAPLSLAPLEEWDLAEKDESLFTFSKKKVAADAIISKQFYDRQEISAMLKSDWADQKKRLDEIRDAIVKSLAYCHRNVRHEVRSPVFEPTT